MGDERQASVIFLELMVEEEIAPGREETLCRGSKKKKAMINRIVRSDDRTHPFGADNPDLGKIFRKDHHFHLLSHSGPFHSCAEQKRFLGRSRKYRNKLGRSYGSR